MEILLLWKFGRNGVKNLRIFKKEEIRKMEIKNLKLYLRHKCNFIQLDLDLNETKKILSGVLIHFSQRSVMWLYKRMPRDSTTKFFP